MDIRNEDVRALLVEIPADHTHMRATVVLHDGREIMLREATIANLVTEPI